MATGKITGTGVANFTSLGALTKEQYIPKMVDNIKKKSVLLSRFLGKSKPNASGNQIHQPLEHADSASIGFYKGYDELSVDPGEFSKSAKYGWAQAYASVSISGFEERVNDSPEKLVDLLGAKMKNAEKSLSKKFSEVMYGINVEEDSDETDSADVFVSLKDVASQSKDLGGLSVSGNAWWKGAFDTDKDAIINALGSGTYFDQCSTIIDEIFREGWEAMSRNSGDKPSLIVVPQVVFDCYEQHLSDKKRTPTMGAGEMADAGFTAMKYRGVDLVVDPSCPKGEAYFINEEYLRMMHSRKANFTFSGFKNPVTQDAKTGHILWMGQLVCSNRAKAVGRFHGLPQDYTATVTTADDAGDSAL